MKPSTVPKSNLSYARLQRPTNKPVKWLKSIFWTFFDAAQPLMLFAEWLNMANLIYTRTRLYWAAYIQPRTYLAQILRLGGRCKLHHPAKLSDFGVSSFPDAAKPLVSTTALLGLSKNILKIINTIYCENNITSTPWHSVLGLARARNTGPRKQAKRRYQQSMIFGFSGTRDVTTHNFFPNCPICIKFTHNTLNNHLNSCAKYQTHR